MKEASGELSMTVVVIVGAVALVGIVGWLLGDGGPARTWIEGWFGSQTTETVTLPTGGGE